MQRRRAVFIVVALALVCGVTAGLFAPATRTPAAGDSPEMHLDVSGPGVNCFGSAPGMKCVVNDIYAAFSVKVLGSCCKPGSAGGFQSEVYGVSDLGYVMTSCAAEVTMTPSGLCLGPVIGAGGQVSHGNATGLLPPVPAWSNAPNLAAISLTCGGVAGIAKLTLTAYDSDLNAGGSYFSNTQGTIVDVARRGTAMLDMDGPGGYEPVELPIADEVTIQCGLPDRTYVPPLPTPTPPTPTPTTTATPVPGASPEMHLDVSGPSVNCTGSPPDTKCVVMDLDTPFSVMVLGGCCNPGSATGFQSELFGVSGLEYVVASCDAEVRMRPTALCLGPAFGRGGQVAHGNATSVAGPPLPWANPPDLVMMTLTCGGMPGIRELILTAYDELNPLGSQFWSVSNVGVVHRGTAMLDRDGSGGSAPMELPIADEVTIQCGTAAGDASCDGMVNAIDSLLILQFHARLLPALGCPLSADANQDETVDPLDAMLILQYDAGLLHQLPP